MLWDYYWYIAFVIPELIRAASVIFSSPCVFLNTQTRRRNKSPPVFFLVVKLLLKMNLLTPLLFFVLFFAMSVQADEAATEKRLDGVAERGAQIMPFDLEQTTHVFSKTEWGGLQQIIVKDNTNTRQIKLVRDHLSKISREFADGDFSDPERIHGKDMPGLTELSAAKPGRIKIVYKELPNGAEIAYTSDYPEIISAIHRWFDAQLSDHARHAMPGHSQHNMHGK